MSLLKEITFMSLYVLSFRRCLMIVGCCLAWSLTCAAQKPQPVPTPVVRLCEAPSLVGRASRGVGSGSGSATVSDEVKEVFTQSEVTKKAEVLFRPTPDYTALKADVAEGRVELRVVLCPRGYVSNIEILSKASGDFIEKAVEAAREIRFIPAEKDGKRVAQYATVVYSHQVY
jgi:TonB family protein